MGHEKRLNWTYDFTTINTGLPFFRSSGFPFLTVATIMSPDPAAGRRFRRPLMPWTAMTNKFLAPAKRHTNVITRVHPDGFCTTTIVGRPRGGEHVSCRSLRTGVVGAIDDGADGQTQGNPELRSGGTTTS